MTTATTQPRDSKPCLQGFLLLDLCVRLLIWSSSLALTIATMTALDNWPQGAIIGAHLGLAWTWGEKLIHVILFFNLYYVVCLVVLRLLIPTPREGTYSTAPGVPLNRNLVYAAFIAMLTKARYHAPFPGFLVFHVANLPPLRWLMDPIFGPRSKSCYVLDPIIGDPHMTEIGRNVVFGFNCSVTAHTQQRDSIVIRKVTIGDDVLIGANAVIFSGTTIGRGAVILSGAVVPPDTTIGDYEIWGGLPAKKLKNLPAPATESA